MEHRLGKGVYVPGVEGPFGLTLDQIRDKPTFLVTERARWHNALGQRIGHGDLSGKDLWRMTQEMNERELFIIIPPLRAKDTMDPLLRAKNGEPEKEPTADLVAANAVYAVVPGRVYVVEPLSARPAERLRILGLKAEELSRDLFRDLMNQKAAALLSATA